VNAACPDCPEGIDLRQANFSISIFARSLLANCEQVGQIIYNHTQKPAGESALYEDLWRLTLVNYNAGPGCLNSAVGLTLGSNYPLTWENVIRHLQPGACQTSIDYVNDIAKMPDDPDAEPTPLAQPTTISPTATVMPTQTPENAPTEGVPTPTPTEYGYP